MAVKRKNEKKLQKKILDNASCIACKYCDLKDNCKVKERKESNERKGIITYCIITPNKGKKNGKDKRINKHYNKKYNNINKEK